MSEQVEKLIISVEIAEGATSVAELRKQLNGAKDVLVSANKESKEYKEALQVAAIATKKLSDANLEIKKNLPTNSIAQLRAELKAAKDAMLMAEKGSKEYFEALKKASEASDRLRDSQREIVAMEGSALGSALGASAKTMGTLVQGFTAATAAAQMFGIENKGVVEGIAKLQQLTAIASGLKGLPELGKQLSITATTLRAVTQGTWLATAAQKAWNIAMSMNPIAALVLAVTALIAGITALVSWLRKNNKEQEEANRLLRENADLLESTKEANNLKIRMLEAEGKSTLEIIEAKRQMLFAEKSLVDAEISRLKSKKKLSDDEKKVLDDLMKKNEEYSALIKRTNEDEIIEKIKLRKKAEEEERKMAEEAKQRAMQIAEERKKQRQKELEDAEMLKKRELEQIAQINEAIRQEQLSEIDRLREKYEAQRALFEKHGADITMLTKKYEAEVAEVKRKEEEARLQREEEARQRELELKKAYNEQYIKELERYWAEISLRNYSQLVSNEITQSEYNHRELTAKIAHYQELINSGKVSAEEELNIQRQLLEAKKTLMDAELEHRRALVSSIGSLLSVASEFAGKNTASGKALAIAATTISTWQAAQQAYLSAFMPVPTPASPYLAAANVAAAVAVGLKNIREITKVKVPGGGGGFSTPSPSVSAPQLPKAPQIEQQPLQVVDTSERKITIEGSQIRAYVVDKDLVDAEKKREDKAKNTML